MACLTPGARFRLALTQETPLQIAGAVNAYSAMLAARAGFRAIYLSGAGVANASLGLPDLGLTSLDDVLVDVRRITSAVSLPLLVDIDTGWGSELNIARAVAEVARAGGAAVHIEDQLSPKRCGHRPNKAIVPVEEMVARLRAAVAAKADPDFLVMARTDALAVEGFDAVLDRISAFEAAGADAIFAEAMTDLEMYRQVVDAVSIPVLANITEFGKTPLFRTQELAEVGVRMALYPLSAFRGMSRAAENVFSEIRQRGTQQGVIDSMQSRAELYQVLDYESYERQIDQSRPPEPIPEANSESDKLGGREGAS